MAIIAEYRDEYGVLISIDDSCAVKFKTKAEEEAYCNQISYNILRAVAEDEMRAEKRARAGD